MKEKLNQNMEQTQKSNFEIEQFLVTLALIEYEFYLLSNADNAFCPSLNFDAA